VRVTAGLTESNSSLPPGLWQTSHAGWLPRTRISSWTLSLAIEYGLPLPFINFSHLAKITIYFVMHCTTPSISCTYFQSRQKCHANRYLGCIALSVGFPLQKQTANNVCTIKLSHCYNIQCEVLFDYLYITTSSTLYQTAVWKYIKLSQWLCDKALGTYLQATWHMVLPT